MKATRTPFAVAAAALLGLAAPAGALDLFGYMRDSIGGNSRGGAQACFRTPGMDYKLRLGNECDAYAEWGLQQTLWKDRSGVEFVVGFMFDYDPEVMSDAGASTPFGVQQGYVKVKLPQWSGAQVWAGKQYYRRENIDMIDFFYLNTSEPGFGVEDVDLGFGKLAASLFATRSGVPAGGEGVPPAQDFAYAYWRPDLRLYGIPANPRGSIEVDANLVLISRNRDAPALSTNQATTSLWLTVEHTQEALTGGFNKAAVQWASGAAAQMGPGAPTGYGDDPANRDNMQLRILDQLLLQPSLKLQGLIGGMVQWKQLFVGTARTRFTQWGLFARPVYWVSDYFKLQGDIGFTANEPEHGSAANLFKVTFAPTLSPTPGQLGGFFVRPEIRLFVTFAAWNDAAAAVKLPPTSPPAPRPLASTPSPVTNVPFGDARAMVSFGMSVETWF